jgi:hydroxymethylpyrimidine pyrophosphatase-like HAD family hydrolase
MSGTTPRLVATDLDGTLVRSDRTVSMRSVEVLNRISARGTVVVLATGRPIRWLSTVYAHLRPRPITVCVNGAAVYDPDRDRILHTRTLAPAVLAEACERLRAVAPDVVFGVERDGGRLMRYQPGYPIAPGENGRAEVKCARFAELIRVPAAKLLARRRSDLDGPAAPERSDRLTALARRRLAGLAEATHSSSSGLVEISAAGVTKASGLGWVAARFGIPASEVLAFGDMPNDLPMLAWAGRSVAVANAHRAVLAAVDEVTAGHDEDGVAVYLERFLA